METQETYLSEFGEVLLYIVGGVLFVLSALIVSFLVRPNRPNAEKLSTYESGEEPVGTAWSQFNMRFYIIALIFILFEVELIFLFPWATIFANEELINETNGLWGVFTMVEMVIFILILGLALAYAWINGFLDWVKPDPKPTAFKSPVPRKMYEALNDRYK
jgi:NADH-quinone oxidoreductase subunit A